MQKGLVRLRAVVLAAFLLAALPTAAWGLAIVSAMPEGEVADLSQITVRFSEPVQPLGQGNSTSVPLELTPDTGTLPKGNFRWVDPSTLVYFFDTPVLRPLTITARVPKGTRAAAGSLITVEKTWRISTPPLSLGLAGEKPLPRTKAKIVLRANYPLDTRLLGRNVSLHHGSKALTAAPVRERVAGYGPQGRPAAWEYIFAVTGPLPQNSTVSLRVAPGVEALHGGPALGPLDFSLPTYKTLRLLGWEINGQQAAPLKGAMPPEGRLSLSFSNPLRYKDLLARLKVTPTPTRDEGYDLPPDAVGESFALPFRWEPRTQYTITLRPGLRDTYGTALATGEQFTVSTGDRAPLLLAPQGNLVMEAPLASFFPILLRNAGAVTARLRHIPWGEEAYRILHEGDTSDTPTFLRTPAARETAISLGIADAPNKTIRRVLDIPAVLGFSSPGPLPGLLTLTLGQNNQKDDAPNALGRPRTATIQVTDLSLVVRMGGRSGIAWVTDMGRGQPQAGVWVRLLDKTGTTLWQGITDSQGRALLPGDTDLPATPWFCQAATDTDSILLDLPATGFPRVVPGEADKGNGTAREAALRRMHIVSQLPLYRPGQAVNAVAFFREAKMDGNGISHWHVLAGEPLRLRVEDRNGRTVHTAEGRTNAYGSLPLAFTLKKDAEPGSYQVVAELAQPEKGNALWASPFSVGSFRPPDFAVTVTPPAPQPRPAAKAPPLRASIATEYLSGAPLPNGSVALTGEVRASHFAPERLAGYATGPDRPLYRHGGRRAVATFSLTATLDGTGKTSLPLPALTAPKDLPADVFLTATVTDAAALTSQGAASFILHPSAWYIGLRTPFMAAQGHTASLELKAATWDNAPLVGTKVTLTAHRVLPGANNPEKQREKIWEKQITLAEEHGDHVEVSFEKSGLHIVTATVTDPQGRNAMAQSRVHVPGPDLAWSGGNRGRSLELLTESREYTPGETARIIVKNPFPEGASALVTLERNGVVLSFTHVLRGPAAVIALPLHKTDAPHVHVAVTLMRGRTASPPKPATGPLPEDAPSPLVADRGAPALASGTILLTVTGSPSPLGVSLATDAAVCKPGGTATATVRVTNPGGDGKKAQVTLVAVDERYLRAAGEASSWNPDETFDTLLPRNLRQADSLRFLLARAMPHPAPEGRLFLAKSTGMGAPSLNAFPMDSIAQSSAPEAAPIRQDFSPLVHWLADGETDSEGLLISAISLPHTLTRHHIVAIAADTEGNFAQARQTVTVAQPLQLLSALPRFVTEGDSLDAAILVQNTGPTREMVTVTARATGALLAETVRTITLDAGQSGTVAFPLTIADLSRSQGALTLDINADMGAATDAAQFTIPVTPARSLEVTAAAGVLAQGEHLTVPAVIPSSLDERSSLTVTFGASPVSGVFTAVGQVMDYPWHCLEQDLSRAWVRAIRLRHGHLLGLGPEKADRDNLTLAMASLADRQGEDGSFSLWPGLRGSLGDKLFLTAYALLVARDADRAGVPLSPPVRNAALTFLEKTLADLVQKQPSAMPVIEAGLQPGPESYALALAALALHKPEAAAPYLPRILTLCEERTATPLAWGSLLIAIEAAGALPDAPAVRARIRTALEKTAAVTATTLHFATADDDGAWRTLGSTLRDNGLVLAALAGSMPDYPRLDALARWVGQGLGNARTLSTQEAAFGLWGLAAYGQHLDGESGTAVVAVWDKKDEAVVTFKGLADPPVIWTLPADKLNPGATTLNLRATKGTPYWTVRLACASPATLPQEENAGISLTRSPAGSVSVGGTLAVTVTMTVTATRRHVLLFEPFPAGFEPLFATRADLAVRDRQWQAPWQWQDELDDGMLLYAPVVHPGTYTYTYTLRAMASGTFTRRAARAEAMYAPEVFGTTGAERVTVVPR